MIKNYFKTAFRNLLRNRVYSFINIFGLSLGLVCAMLIMLYVKDEVSYDRFHKNAANIYRVDKKLVRDNGSTDNSGYTGYVQGPRFTENIPGFKRFVRLQQSAVEIKSGTDIQSQPVCLVDSNFFSEFSFPLLSGNPETVLLQPNSVVLSEEIAKKHFGAANAMGKTLLFKEGDKFVPYVVTGVARNCPQNSSIKFQVLLPLKVSPEEENNKWFNSFLNTFIILAPNTDAKATAAKMQKVFETDAKESIQMIREKYGIKNLGVSFFLEPLTAIHLGKEVAAQDQVLSDVSKPAFSFILSGIAVFILLIACINFVNLTVARSVKRAKEIGIRKVIGGNRKQLMLQFLGESFILCLLAFVSAVLIVQFTLPVFNQLSNKALALSYLFDIKLIAGYVALFIGTSLLAGFYPALILSNYNPVQTLYSRFTLAGKNYLQKSLVVLQFSLASFLIIATLTIFSQFNYLTTQKIGYDDTNLVTVGKWIETQNGNDVRLFKDELRKNSTITDIGLKNNGYSGTTVKVNSGAKVNIIWETVDESYIPLLKIPVVKGRNFSPAFPSDSIHSVVVNETFVKQAGWKEPIGQQVDIMENNEKYTVIGVVKDYHFKPLTEKIEPQLFSMSRAIGYGIFYIKIKPGTETASLQHIEKTFKKLFPISPYYYTFKDQENMRNYEAEARWKQIMLFGAILTIFISCIGLFGLSVLSAEKRIKEIGIRKVLGASVSSVVTILSGDFVKLVVIALLVAIPAAWIAANKWLENYPYRITLTWWMFASAGALVVLIALATVSFQAIRAAVANPVKSLRTE